jgi:hypothetical protein
MKYGRLIDAVRSGSGRWVKISLDEVSGETAKTKSARIWQAANLRGIRIQTTQQGEFFYIRQVGLVKKSSDDANLAGLKGVETDEEA